MSVDYSISIHRKRDDKKIGEICCNFLKTIFECDVTNTFEHYDDCNKKYTIDDIHHVVESSIKEIEMKYGKIHEKKMMIPMCVNATIKSQLEEDINYLKEDINLLFYTIENAERIYGQIDCIVEDNIKIESSDDEDGWNIAYKYNMDDLNKDKKEDDRHDYLWNDDIYFKINALY